MILPLLLLLLFSAGNLSAAGEGTTQEGSFAVSSQGRRGTAPFTRALEQAEKRFFQITRYSPGGGPPVEILLRDPGSAPSLSVDALEGGVPSLRLSLSSDPDDPETGRFAATALLLREYYGKNAPVPGSKVPRYPDWVTRGMGALMFPRSGEATPFPGNSTPELAAFLTERVPDPEGVTLLRRYDTTASILVRSGLSDDAGRKAFREWVGAYDPSASPVDPPRWVSGWDMRSVERRWVLGLQSSGSAEDQPVRISSAEATFGDYARIMDGVWANNGSLADLRQEKGYEFRLGGLADRLTALRLQGNPIAAPLIDSTLKLVQQAKRTAPAKIRSEESLLRDQLAALRKQSQGIAEYLDWYEAAKVPVSSGLFDQYLSAPEVPVRKGPVGRHLDAVEARGW